MEPEPIDSLLDRLERVERQAAASAATLRRGVPESLVDEENDRDRRIEQLESEVDELKRVVLGLLYKSDDKNDWEAASDMASRWFPDDEDDE